MIDGKKMGRVPSHNTLPTAELICRGTANIRRGSIPKDLAYMDIYLSNISRFETIGILGRFIRENP